MDVGHRRRALFPSLFLLLLLRARGVKWQKRYCVRLRRLRVEPAKPDIDSVIIMGAASAFPCT